MQKYSHSLTTQETPGQSLFPVLSSPFLANLGSHLLSPENPHYMSKKPFHILTVCARDIISLDPNQMLGRVHPVSAEWLKHKFYLNASMMCILFWQSHLKTIRLLKSTYYKYSSDLFILPLLKIEEMQLQSAVTKRTGKSFSVPMISLELNCGQMTRLKDASLNPSPWNLMLLADPSLLNFSCCSDPSLLSQFPISKIIAGYSQVENLWTLPAKNYFPVSLKGPLLVLHWVMSSHYPLLVFSSQKLESHACFLLPPLQPMSHQSLSLPILLSIPETHLSFLPRPYLK